MDTFTDQDGVIWDLSGGKCPECGVAVNPQERVFPSGYFRCLECRTLFDEPDWDEGAFIGTVDDD